MGAIEDVRKALQDIVAPDLKALQVEVKEGFASVERVAAIRHELVLADCGLPRRSLSLGTKPFSERWTSTNVWSGSKRGRRRNSPQPNSL